MVEILMGILYRLAFMFLVYLFVKLLYCKSKGRVNKDSPGAEARPDITSAMIGPIPAKTERMLQNIRDRAEHNRSIGLELCTQIIKMEEDRYIVCCGTRSGYSEQVCETLEDVLSRLKRIEQVKEHPYPIQEDIDQALMDILEAS